MFAFKWKVGDTDFILTFYTYTDFTALYLHLYPFHVSPYFRYLLDCLQAKQLLKTYNKKQH